MRGIYINELITVVIPIYKVEKYLDACIESVVNQSYQNIEIILVNDGSPDRCGSICEEWAKKDIRMRVFHKKNGGLSDARNYGAERAHGVYIAFIDSDDVVAPDYIEYLYRMVQQANADMACCDYLEFQRDQCVFSAQGTNHIEIMSGRRACELLLGKRYLFFVIACAKLCRAEIVRRYPFPVGHLHEDEATTCKYFYSSSRVVVSTRQLYGYRQREQSIMHTDGQKGITPDAMWAFQHRAEWFAEKGEPSLERKAQQFGLNALLSDSLKFNGRSDTQLWTTAREYIRERNVTPKTTIKLLVYRVIPGIYRLYYRSKMDRIERKRQ